MFLFSSATPWDVVPTVAYNNCVMSIQSSVFSGLKALTVPFFGKNSIYPIAFDCTSKVLLLSSGLDLTSAAIKVAGLSAISFDQMNTFYNKVCIVLLTKTLVLLSDYTGVETFINTANYLHEVIGTVSRISSVASGSVLIGMGANPFGWAGLAVLTNLIFLATVFRVGDIQL